MKLLVILAVIAVVVASIIQVVIMFDSGCLLEIYLVSVATMFYLFLLVKIALDSNLTAGPWFHLSLCYDRDTDTRLSWIRSLFIGIASYGEGRINDEIISVSIPHKLAKFVTSISPNIISIRYFVTEEEHIALTSQA